MKYFTGIKTLEELKKAFRDLAKRLHPDNGGSKEKMQELNAEFEQVLKNGFTPETETEKREFAAAGEYAEIINQIIGLDGLEVEICGSWVWVTGNTYSHKEILKNAGFKWGAKKKAWYWRPEWAAVTSHKNFTLDDIRFKYGSEKVKASARVQIA